MSLCTDTTQKNTESKKKKYTPLNDKTCLNEINSINRNKEKAVRF